MPVYPVDESPKKIAGTNIQPFILKNSGSKTVYLGQDSSLTVGSRAFSVTPGGVLQWPGQSTEIWAVTETGDTSEIEILYESQASYTPGPDVVTVLTDVNSVLDVLITAGTSYVSPRIAVSQFGSLHLEFFAQLGAIGVYDGTKDYILSIQWFGEASGGFPFSEVMGLGGAGETYVSTPVKAPYFELSILRVDGSDLGPNLGIVVVGVQNALNSYQCIPDPGAYNTTAFSALAFNDVVQQRSGMTAVSYTIGVPLTATVPIAHSAGPASVGFSRLIQTGAGNTTLQLLTAAVGALSGIVWYQNLAAAGTLLERGIPLILPRWPLSIAPSRSAVGVTNSGILEISTDPSQ